MAGGDLMTVSAYAWGYLRDSCHNAKIQRSALGPDATQSDWWKICPRPDWLLWNIGWLEEDYVRGLMPGILGVVEKTVEAELRQHLIDNPDAESWIRERLRDRCSISMVSQPLPHAVSCVRGAVKQLADDDVMQALLELEESLTTLCNRRTGHDEFVPGDVVEQLRRVLPAEWPADKEVKP